MSSWPQERKDAILDLVMKSRERFSSMKPLLRIGEKSKVAFVGDTHGAYNVTKYVFDKYWDYDAIVFLGDYVDREPYGLENLELILSRFLENQEKVVVLRGNHESPLTNDYYGFKAEVKEKLGEEAYPEFVNLFANMPYAAIVNNYLCVHGGIARNLKKVEQIEDLKKPDIIPEDEIAFEMLWNDPREELDGFVPNIRGEGTFFYGKDVTLEFLKENSLAGIIRGHEVADGMRWELDERVITVFSSRYHKMRAGILLQEQGKFNQVFLDETFLFNGDKI
ncbi:metallophosphoesterase [Metallosphaera hakonensis]|uniref:Serine/threonine protein phosphatase n=1 Tax=Metallosphaera hakonensis JCM 8857 = DSM 7519 TaxID=1293036 RepID=A0A2U9IVT4_9CREN|nr:metallophosphoesterase [Metallosphaera hakonensis]AWS00170.1 serine/threonine protein phosphatase [Metallosphaera hakonensis JCM 8857 = DSM 7519]